MPSPRFAFIGAGNMAAAIIRGLLDKKVCAAADIGCTSKSGVTAQKLAAATGITAESDLTRLLAPADVIIVAFKPQSLAGADPRLAELTAGKLVISLLAGKKVATLTKTFPAARNIVRTMPNTPSSIGAGFTSFCTRTPLAPADRQAVEAMLDALGKYLETAEEKLDALTALGGDAGFAQAGDEFKKKGRPAAADTAATVALETVLGSARLLARSGEAPEALRDKVTSPNGTTYAGLQVLAARQFRDTLKETILAATKRAGELSKDT